MLDQLQHLLAVGDGLVLDRPPQQQGDVQVGDVLGPRQQLRDDGQGDRAGEALAGAGELVAHRRAWLALGQLHEPVALRGRDLAPVAQQADRPGPDVVDGMVEQLAAPGRR